MSTKYAQLITDVPQTIKADPRQVQNSAGGFVFAVGSFERLARFLVLGTPSATYYATQKALTLENAACVRECLAGDGLRTVETITALSESGRAPKNDPAIFALALALVHGVDVVTKEAARAAILRVCRTGTHLLQFVEALETLGKWGRGNKRAVARWYLNKAPSELAYQLLKYQRRGSWSHRDVLRLAHPRAKQPNLNAVLRWAVARDQRGERVVKRGKGDAARVTYPAIEALPPLLAAYDELLSEGTDSARAVALVKEHRMTHEMVPPRFKGERDVWEALLESMPLGALFRNLAQLTARGILAEGSAWASNVAARLVDVAQLKRARIHPISALSALRVYQKGHGDKGKLSWSPVVQITNALESAFYASFQNVEPTNKRHLLAVDVSGSMTAGEIAGVPGLTPLEAALAMAMAVARTEPNHEIVAYSHRMVPLPITADMRLSQVTDVARRIPFGATDCAQPILYADRTGKAFDGIVSLTDNESWAGPIHVHTALQRYRVSVPHARLVAVGMTATEFTVCDPQDARGLNVVGFDSAAPQLIADFVRDA